jgi:hypothetical protein
MNLYHVHIDAILEYEYPIYICNLNIEMPVLSQGHYGFHSFPVVDWFCLFI